ncbi:ATP-dependent helicase HrpB [Methylobacterium gregans]|uniref:ATP-dependent RNA helicase HrpB n=1 Tax=Methylobacterium gregans TaxID=374424 RepID=A0AA37HKN6_9HYPH|nr:ATP-dependent helicase HrpB [Methylobacterium gregans]MDQ0522829.1 ATP-dependent helicase HrpB [Methylobacterium gregans]GJD77126.1 ATP-dependent RNA helicase HrpB [Methylobacterium gregans]GLS55724.1 ATP-dependent helicase [Methylobacterium gregans]
MPAAVPPVLPIDAVLPRLRDALTTRTGIVLVAPPGAGKTTRVPLDLLDAPWLGDRRIVLLEPRRLAARAAAERMATTLGERVGDTVGLRVRLGSKISARTRIEVVTEGVFTRMILDDPELARVGAVLFDEFHERSLDADLGLALALDAQGALREDLRVLVMSATLDGARVARLLGDAPVIESEGRAYPIETRYVERDPNQRVEAAMTDLILRALRADPGSVLAFLPGQAEIRRVAEALEGRVGPEVDVAPLYGALTPAEQDRAVSPAPSGRRKVVLATSIAETSLTIEGVRIVVDSGLARVPHYEPGLGLTRLVTARASRASVDQRRGRAGRTEPGVCWRLWSEAATGALDPFGRPEILAADLAGLVLDCAAWGVTDPTALAFLDTPPAPALREARAMLLDLDALDADGRLTGAGRALRALPLPPRLARMVVSAAERGQAGTAADLAAVLVERGLGGDAVDLAERLDRFRRDRGQRAADMRRLSAGWAKLAGGTASAEHADSGSLLVLAYPDRVAKGRGRDGEFVMANGRAGRLDPAAALAREPFIVVADLAGAAGNARILAAAAIAPEAIETAFAGRIEAVTQVSFDPQARALRARALRRLGAVTLGERTLPVPGDREAAIILARGVCGLGLDRLPWTPALRQWLARARFLRAAEGEPWPDLSDAVLADTAVDWLAPEIVGRTSLDAITADDLARALHGLLDWSLRARMENAAPTHVEVPTGSRIPVDYEAEGGPVLAVRVQELFGLDRHPAAGGRPLVLHLLSPAQRPIQITRDLPGFWRGSWASVRTEMRGRYPRHPWPDDPLAEAPTRRAKPRGT